MSLNHPPDARRRFVELLRQHRRIVGKVCAVYAGPGDREDLFQEIVMQLWRSWPSFRSDSSFATWAYRVALNTALFQHRRAVKMRAPDARGAADGDLAMVSDSVESGPAEAVEAARLLHECIRSLPELDRAIVLLHLEARPHAEIAEFTGLSVGNVGVRLHRIKRGLRKCLAAKGYTEE